MNLALLLAIPVVHNILCIYYFLGAQCAMRYLENHKLAGVILVAPCVTDMGVPNEKASGYYDRPWQYDQIKSNAGFVVQFSSLDDPFIDYASEQAPVAKALDAELYLYKEEGHFLHFHFPDMVKLVKNKLLGTQYKIIV